MRFLAGVLVAALYLQNASAERILAICAVTSPSHSLWCYRYMAVLAEKGHQITVLGVDEPKFKIPNLTTFVDNTVYQSVFSADLVDEYTSENPNQGGSKLKMLFTDFKFFNEASIKGMLESKALKDLLDRYKNIEKPFDLIIHDNTNSEALLGLVHVFGYPPLLLATTMGTPQWMAFRAGNIFNPAYVPNMMLDGEPLNTFYDRLINTFFYVATEYFYHFVTLPYQEKMMKKTFGLEVPKLTDLMKRANVVIVNHLFALDGARPMLPGVIGISGLHIPKPQPLPKDIKEFMDGAKDGVILFSFGSNVDSKWLPKDTGKIILEALQGLPQRVLWKWDQTFPELPPNIRISKWLPQGDMMAHPKLRLFVTHCGLLSTQEAIYRKVPVLALPVFFDQVNNAGKLVRRNLTIQLDVYSMTSKILRGGIQEILSNPKYKANIVKLGELISDTPLTAQQQALYWTEYAMKHQGAVHLHSVAADLPWHQLLLLDIVAVILTVVVVIIWLLKKIIMFALRKTVFRKVKKE